MCRDTDFSECSVLSSDSACVCEMGVRYSVDYEERNISSVSK